MSAAGLPEPNGMLCERCASTLMVSMSVGKSGGENCLQKMGGNRVQ